LQALPDGLIKNVGYDLLIAEVSNADFWRVGHFYPPECRSIVTRNASDSRIVPGLFDLRVAPDVASLSARSLEGHVEPVMR
jgi:hypothetical protein